MKPDSFYVYKYTHRGYGATQEGRTIFLSHHPWWQLPLDAGCVLGGEWWGGVACFPDHLHLLCASVTCPLLEPDGRAMTSFWRIKAVSSAAHVWQFCANAHRSRSPPDLPATSHTEGLIHQGASYVMLLGLCTRHK